MKKKLPSLLVSVNMNYAAGPLEKTLGGDDRDEALKAIDGMTPSDAEHNSSVENDVNRPNEKAVIIAMSSVFQQDLPNRFNAANAQMIGNWHALGCKIIMICDTMAERKLAENITANYDELCTPDAFRLNPAISKMSSFADLAKGMGVTPNNVIGVATGETLRAMRKEGLETCNTHIDYPRGSLNGDQAAKAFKKARENNDAIDIKVARLLLV